jgi:NAD(P)-dependent dehydrogenase (short-subunit alcohol dehydrogenase family)
VLAGRVVEFVHVRDMTAWVRKAPSADGAVPSWTSGPLPLSEKLAAAVGSLQAEGLAASYAVCDVSDEAQVQAAAATAAGGCDRPAGSLRPGHRSRARTVPAVAGPVRSHGMADP